MRSKAKESLIKNCPNLIVLQAVLKEDSSESLLLEKVYPRPFIKIQCYVGLFVEWAKVNFESNPFIGENIPLELALVQMSEMSREPLIFSEFFKRKNPDFY